MQMSTGCRKAEPVQQARSKFEGEGEVGNKLEEAREGQGRRVLEEAVADTLVAAVAVAHTEGL